LQFDTERRKHKRFKYEALISHDVSIDGNIYPGQMFNFSKGGLYFESDQVIYPGEEIFVTLAIHVGSAGQETQLIFEVKVLWHTALKDASRRYGYGGKFLSTHDALTETGQIQKKIAEKNASGSYDFRGENDSRKQARKPYHKSLRFAYDRREYKGIVADIGRGGAFILTKEKFALGARLKLVIPQLKPRKALAVTGWIVRISPQGIGVSFERRAGRERRSDLDRRTGFERRSRKRRKPGS
jgi:Tfp pilus assembly protein PilZ